ncbi:MAG: hypothetical protein ACTSVY_03870, partial [Candidatus Helarchaeota archaeon]
MSSIDTKRKKPSINLILLIIALFIVGILGLVIITQIEMVRGWKWTELRDIRPVSVRVVDVDNGEGIVIFTDMNDLDYKESMNNSPQYGLIMKVDRCTGSPIWSEQLNGPVKFVYPFMDIDSDGAQDYLAHYATVNENWTSSNQVNITKHAYGLQLVSGRNGTFLPINVGDGANYTHEQIIDIESLTNLTDDIEDFIVVQNDEDVASNNLTGFFINGTIKNTLNVTNVDLIGIDLLSNVTHDNLFIIGENISTSSSFYSLRELNNYSKEIYTKEIIGVDISKYVKIGDLDGDGISEYVLSGSQGKLLLINGTNGNQILNTSEFENANFEVKNLAILYENSGYTDIVLDMMYNFGNVYTPRIIRVTTSGFGLRWSTSITTKYGMTILLNGDNNGDGYPDLLLDELITPIGSQNEMSKFILTSGSNGNQLGITILDVYPNQGKNAISVNDIDGDGCNDICFPTWGSSVVCFSTKKPFGMWFNSEVPFGFVIFLIFISMVVIGSIMLVLGIKRKLFQFEARKGIRQNIMTIIVCSVILTLMILIFLLFSFSMNVFNNTMLSLDVNANVEIFFFVTFIIWFGCLPLTAAVYNKLSPHGAYLFIKLRKFMFKFSRNVDHEIIVIEMDKKLGLGIVHSLRRCILPILLSITIGLFTYNTFATQLGFPTTFSNVGSIEFNRFLSGYMLLGMVPMVLSFFIFFFLVPASW